MKKLLKKYGFTLVELIVVVVILAVLAAIAFMMVSKWIGASRDSNRLSTLAVLRRGIDTNYIEKGKYPFPDADNEEGKVITGTMIGQIVLYKGTIGDGVIKDLGNLFSKTPLDPMGKRYAYGVTASGREYAIGTVLENETKLGIVNQAYGANYKTKLDGTYLGMILFSTGGKQYISNIPSLLFTVSGSVNDSIDMLSSDIYYAVNSGNNLPYALGDKSISQKDDITLVLKSQLNIPNPSLEVVEITNITDLSNTFSGDRLASFGGNLSTIQSTIKSQSGITTTASSSSASFTNCSSTTYNGYTIPDTNHGLSGSATKDVTENNGTFRYTQNFECNNGAFNYTSQTGPEYVNCNENYTWNSTICTIQLGECGDVNGDIVASSPSTNLCNVGTPSSVSYSTGMGTYNWTCTAGSAVNCKAYDNYIVTLMHFNGNITDETGRVWTKYGGASTVVDSNTKPGFGESLKITTKNVDYLWTPSNGVSDFQFGAGDYTIDFWAWISADDGTSASYFVNMVDADSASAAIWRNLAVYASVGGVSGGYYNTSMSPASRYNFGYTSGTFNYSSPERKHIALVKKGTSVKLYVGGVAVKSATNSDTLGNFAKGLYIGRRDCDARGGWVGYMDELRISKGIARRSGDFTPPTSPY